MRSILFVGVILLSSSSYSQQYKTAIGVKGDWSNLNYDLALISVKHFFNSPNAIEGNLGFGNGFIWTEAMYHRNFTLKGDLDWYAGAGLDLGYWSARKNDRLTAPHYGFWSGSTTVVGLELTTNVIPLNFALDIGPTFRLTPNADIGVKVGFAARYAIK